MNATSNDDRTIAFADWLEVEVTFPSTVNTDLVVPHDLGADDPNTILYLPLRSDRACDVFHDTSATRKPWTSTYILLRSNVANAKVRLLLYVGRDNRKFTF